MKFTKSDFEPVLMQMKSRILDLASQQTYESTGVNVLEPIVIKQISRKVYTQIQTETVSRLWAWIQFINWRQL